MDETRQIVREIREELRSASTATRESVAEKVDRLRVAGASDANGAPSTSGARVATAESSETGPVGPGYGGTSDASEADDAPEGGAEDEGSAGTSRATGASRKKKS